MTTNLDELVDAYKPSFKYAHDNEMLLTAYADRIEKSLDQRPSRHILSLGIGHSIVSGRILERLRRGLFETYTMIEGSKVLIDEFSSKLDPWPQGLKIVHTTFEEYVPPQPFDAIEMGFVLEHVDDPAAIVTRYREYLDARGVMFVAVPNARSLHRQIGNAAGLLTNIYSLSESDRQLGHQRYFDLAALSAMIEGAGLKIRDASGLVLKPLALAQLQQLALPESVWQAFKTVGYGLPDICNGIYLEATL